MKFVATTGSTKIRNKASYNLRSVAMRNSTNAPSGGIVIREAVRKNVSTANQESQECCDSCDSCSDLSNIGNVRIKQTIASPIIGVKNQDMTISIPYMSCNCIMSNHQPFRLPNDFVDAYADKHPPFGFNGLGELVYMRTYARIKPDGTKERWHDTVERVVNGTFNMQKKWMLKLGLDWNEVDTQQLAQEMFDRIFQMKFMPPGRGLWAMGTAITEERGLFAALNNCAFVSTENLHMVEFPSEPFCFLMDAAMLGVGVGFDAKCANVLDIIGVDTTSDGVQMVIADSREGWVDSLRVLLDAYFLGKPRPLFDYSQIRVAGQLIRGFGGVSSGADPLINLHNNIISILDNATGGKITTRIVVDIMNMIGVCVISGNVRRTAEIAFGNYDDPEYIDLKNYTKNPDRMNYGWTSNNSVFAKIGMDYSDIAKRIADNGEPGFAWLDNMQNYGRMNGIVDSRDHKACGGNPCVTGDTWTMTSGGPRRVEQLIDSGKLSLFINGKQYYTTDKGFFKTGCKPVFKLTTSEGFELKATSNHLILVKTNATSLQGCAATEWIPMSDLKQGDQVVIMNHSSIIDGWGGNGSKQDGLFLGNVMSDALRMTGSSYVDDNNSTCYITDHIEESSYVFYTNFLYELFKPNSYWDDNGVILLRGGYNTLQRIQRMLIRLGVYSTIKKDNKLHYPASYSLMKLKIDYDNITRFNEIIGLSPNCKTDDGFKLWEALRSVSDASELSNLNISETDPTMCATVLTITGCPNDYVYDCTVPEVSAFDANGIYVHNCLEQTLESYELCCLVETFPNHHTSIEDYKETLKYAYLYAKTVTLGSTHWPKTNNVMTRNRRIGCSMTGIAQFLSKWGINELKLWCDEGYNAIQSYDKIYSDRFAIPRSIKTTSIKPSGTVSLLAGATPGMHFPESRFYIRRVRIAKDSELIQSLVSAGYAVEPAHESPNDTVVVSIPVDVGCNVKTLADVTAWEQMELAAFMQQYWSDNQVSCTITFDRLKEGKQIAPMLDYFQYRLKGISLLPRLDTSEGGCIYPQMPYEQIDEKTYNKMMSSVSLLYFDKTNKTSEKHMDAPDKYCDSSSCQIKIKKNIIPI